MERHPVPQNIMDVEFKLFGSLTIRQFGFLAGGIILALIIYFTGLPDLIKYILVGFFVFMGIFLALVKINGQPSATWITNFIIAMFNSQSRVWRKGAQVPEILTEQQGPLQKPTDELIKDIKKDPSRIAAMPLAKLATVPVQSPLDKQEEQRLQQIEKHFDYALKNLPQTNVTTAQVKKPGSFSPVKAQNPKTAAPLVNNIAQNLAGNTDQQITGETIYQTDKYSAVVKPLMTTQVNRPLGSKSAPEEVYTQNVSAQAQNFNIIKGKVLAVNDTPVAGAVLVIKDLKENLLRKLPTNNKGEFFLTNPLPDGLYYIDIDHGKYRFDRQSVDLASETTKDLIFKAVN